MSSIKSKEDVLKEHGVQTFDEYNLLFENIKRAMDEFANQEKRIEAIEFAKYTQDQDLKRYSEGWCQPGGSNGFHYSDEELYNQFQQSKNKQP